MRLYINECVKAFCRRSTIGIFLALTVLNGVLLWVNESSKKDQLYTAGQYKAVYDSIDKMNADEALEKLTQMQNELDVLEQFSFGEEVSDIYTDADTKSMLEKYNSKSYLKFCDDIYTERQLIADVLKEVQACAEYDSYLDGIDAQARKMTGISLFAEPDSFSYKNIAKTPNDFAHLKGSTLTPVPSKGVDMATGFLPTDIAAFLMIMTVVVTIVTREKELDQITLSRTTYKGRMPLGIAKLLTCFTAAFAALFLLFSVNFAAGYFTYGYGDIPRQIQSVYSFNGSDLKISVVQYFGLFLISKFGVYCLFAALIYLITAVSNSSVKVYAILAVILAAEAVMYYTIPSASYLCPFKYINLIAFANTHDIFAKYLNLNIFGEPFGYKTVFVVSLVILLLTFSILSVAFYTRQKVIMNRSKRFSYTFFKGRNTSLFLQECYKVFIGGRVLLVLLAFGAFVWFGYTPINEKFASSDEIYYKQYMLRLEGELTPENDQFLVDEQAKFDKAQEDMQRELAEGNVFAAMKYQNILAPQTAFEQVKAHADYLKTTDSGEFVYDSGYKLLTGDESAGNKDTTLALTALSMLICTLTYVYCIEYQTGAAVLLHTSPRGRKAVFLRKLVIGMLVLTAVYVLTYVPYFYNVLNAYGTRQLSAPACSLEHLSGWNLSILEYLILISVLRYLGMILSMLLIYFVSRKAKSFISSLLIETAVLIVPLVLFLLDVSAFKWFGLSPVIISNV